MILLNATSVLDHGRLHLKLRFEADAAGAVIIVKEYKLEEDESGTEAEVLKSTITPQVFYSGTTATATYTPRYEKQVIEVSGATVLTINLEDSLDEDSTLTFVNENGEIVCYVPGFTLKDRLNQVIYTPEDEVFSLGRWKGGTNTVVASYDPNTDLTRFVWNKLFTQNGGAQNVFQWERVQAEITGFEYCSDTFPENNSWITVKYNLELGENDISENSPAGFKGVIDFQELGVLQ